MVRRERKQGDKGYDTRPSIIAFLLFCGDAVLAEAKEPIFQSGRNLGVQIDSRSLVTAEIS